MNEENNYNKKMKSFMLGTVFAMVATAVVIPLTNKAFKDAARDRIKAREELDNNRYNHKANMDWKSFDKLPIYEEFPDACGRYAKKEMVRERNGDVTLKITLPIDRCRMKHPNLPKYGE